MEEILKAVEHWVIGIVQRILSPQVEDEVAKALSLDPVLRERTLVSQLKALDKEGKLCWVGERISEEVESQVSNLEIMDDRQVAQAVEDALDNSDYCDEAKVERMITKAVDEAREALDEEFGGLVEKAVATALADIDWETVWRRQLQPHFINALGIVLEQAVQGLSEAKP